MFKNNSIKEISEQDIEKQAKISWINGKSGSVKLLSTSYHEGWIDGIEWYREQLKSNNDTTTKSNDSNI